MDAIFVVLFGGGVKVELKKRSYWQGWRRGEKTNYEVSYSMIRRWIVNKECYVGEWNSQAAFQKVLFGNRTYEQLKEDHIIDKDNILN